MLVAALLSAVLLISTPSGAHFPAVMFVGEQAGEDHCYILHTGDHKLETRGPVYELWLETNHFTTSGTGYGAQKGEHPVGDEQGVDDFVVIKPSPILRHAFNGGDGQTGLQQSGWDFNGNGQADPNEHADLKVTDAGSAAQWSTECATANWAHDVPDVAAILQEIEDAPQI